VRLPSKTRLAEELVTLAERRRTQGLATYGDFDPENDKRILSREGIEELADCYNYLHFAKIKFPKFKNQIQKAQKKVFEAYVDLRFLENAEIAENTKPRG
jgi:hypothetical protein